MALTGTPDTNKNDEDIAAKITEYLNTSVQLYGCITAFTSYRQPSQSPSPSQLYSKEEWLNKLKRHAASQQKSQIKKLKALNDDSVVNLEKPMHEEDVKRL
ncbi:2486_t:CDS:2, partial [Racocetra persica]